MRRIELADTLLALMEGIEPPVGSRLSVSEAILEIPMEVVGAVRGDELVFYGAPPHTRWKSGVLPPVHRTVLRVVASAHLAEEEQH